MASRGFSIVGILIVSIGLVVACSILVMFLASYHVARRNTVELVQDKAQLITSSMITRVRGYLDPAREEIEFLADLVARGQLDPADRLDMGRALIASLAGVPQVSVIAFIDPELQVLRAYRKGGHASINLTDWSDEPSVQQTTEQLRLLTDAYWAELFVAEESGRTFINVRMALRRDKEFLGFLVAGVSIDQLSDFLLEFEQEYTYSPFILYDREHILAHPWLESEFPGLTDLAPLPHFVRFGDPVLSEIWSADRDKELESKFVAPVNARVVHYLDRTYVFLFQHLFDYGESPWIVGTYLHLDDVAQQIHRLSFIPQVGAGILVLALLVAILLGRGLSRPVKTFAQAASYIRLLDIDGAPRLRPGLFRELNEASSAFNAMVEGLKSFETYVPRSLVLRLMMRGGQTTIPSEMREISVLFTDIVGFTALSEHRTAEDVAGLLNEHFQLIADCIEAEGGTLDKYIGDAAMAFWGAPEAQPNHAELASQAAIGIARSIEQDNIRRRAMARPPLTVRIAIHSGPALVGNIGAKGRVNYTVIGDTVNTAERLESLSRRLVPKELDCSILVSEATASQLGAEFHLKPLGKHALRGKEVPVTVFRLLEH